MKNVLTLLLACLLLSLGYQATASSTADHTQFQALQGPFNSPEEVTEACLSCHTEAARQVMETPHWTWDYINEDTGQRLGKKTMLNSFCIADQSNEAFCHTCHIGYGWEDDSFDFADETKVDCLACHNSGDYIKAPGLAGSPAVQPHEWPPGSGNWFDPVDLEAVAQHVGQTSRQTCGSCHYSGGGGDGVKHGDLDSSLNNPHRSLDVHMDAQGLNFSCSDCHQTDNHKVPGSRISMSAADSGGPQMRGKHHEDRNPASCQSCHGDRPHDSSFAHAERLNDHSQKIACQTCHIPEFARGGIATRMEWDWSEAGILDDDGQPFILRDENGNPTYDSRKGSFVNAENVVPDYLWFNGVVDYVTAEDTINPDERVALNHFRGTPGAEDSRIWPVKKFRNQQPYDKVHRTLLKPQVAIPNDTAYWYNFDWDLALKEGTTVAGQPFSGEYGFVRTSMLWPITHMVAPSEEALNCASCHGDEGRLDAVEGIWMPGRDRHKWLDQIGFALAGMMLLGAAGHASMRIIRRKKS